MKKTVLAFVGCGFVADFYYETIGAYSQLEVKGVFDINKDRSAHFATFYNLHNYKSLEAIANDAAVDIVINLTNPASHYEVVKFFLERGKHVYSEKPLADNYPQGKELVALAREKNLYLAGAPCTMLSPTARTIQKGLDEKIIGQPRLVYAEIDDGPVDLMRCEEWKSKSGTHWPVENEFEVGCTQEHAGYYIAWMLRFFGPAERVVAFSKCLKPEKLSYKVATPDFSVGIIYFKSGVVARLTNSIYAPHNHRFTIVGDEGSLGTDNCFHTYAPVYHEVFNPLNLRTFGHPLSKIPMMKTVLRFAGARKKRLKLVEKIPLRYRKIKQVIDFGVGIDEMATAIREKRPAKLSGDFLLHINEIIFALHHAGTDGDIVVLESGF